MANLYLLLTLHWRVNVFQTCIYYCVVILWRSHCLTKKEMHKNVIECIIASCHYKVSQWMTIEYTKELLGGRSRVFMAIEVCILEQLENSILSCKFLKGEVHFNSRLSLFVPCSEPRAQQICAVNDRCLLVWSDFHFNVLNLGSALGWVNWNKKEKWIQRRYWKIREIQKGRPQKV